MDLNLIPQLQKELTESLQARYRNNNEQITIIDLIECTKNMVAVGMLITEKRLGLYTPELLDFYLDTTSSFLQEKFRDFNDNHKEALRIETISLLKSPNAKFLINRHYDGLFGSDGGDVI